MFPQTYKLICKYETYYVLVLATCIVQQTHLMIVAWSGMPCKWLRTEY